MTKNTLIRSLCALLLTLAMAPVAVAQDAPPKLAELWMFELNPGSGQAFRSALRKHMDLRQAQGDPRAWNGYVPLLGDDLNRFVVRYCCAEWADVDAYRAWDDEHPEVAADYVEQVAPHVASVAHYFEVVDWANSHWSDAGGPYRLFAVTEFHVQPEDADDFAEARTKMSQIAIEKGWASDQRSWVWMTSVGGPPVQSIVVPYRNFAALENGRGGFAEFLAEQMGSPEAASELMHDFRSATEGSSYQIWEHLPELSMPPAE